MTDRRSRGASRSSNCFQTSSAFGFLFFMVRSRAGIRGVEKSKVKSRKFTAKTTEKDLTQRETESTGSRRKKEVASRQLTASQAGAQHAAPLQGLGATRTFDVAGQLLSSGKGRAGGKCRAKRKRAKPRSSRRFTQGYYTKTKTLGKP